MNELLRDLNGTPSSTTDFINQYNNFKVPDTLISTNSNPITQHQADDEEEDVIDNEEDDAEDDQDQFFPLCLKINMAINLPIFKPLNQFLIQAPTR